jgi:DNA-directed RNA polymerase
LADLFNPTTPELVEAHNVYIRGLTNALAAGRLEGNDGMKKIRYWFEVEMRAKGVRVNGNTYAIICRAAMVGLERDAQVRNIRRYLHFAEADGVLEDAIASGELSEAEWSQLVDIRHEIFSAEQLSDLPVEALAEQPAQEAQPEWLEVKPVQQKGLGLRSVKDSLVSIYNIDSVPYPHNMQGTQEDKDRKWAELRQEKLEEDVVEVAIARWKEEHEHMLRMGINTKLSSRSMEASLWQWQSSLEAAIKEELVDVGKALSLKEEKEEGEHRTKSDNLRSEYGPYFEAVKPDKMAGITILLALQHCVRNVSEGCKITYLAKRIGAYLEKETSMKGNSTHAFKRTANQAHMLEHRKNLLKRLGRATNATTTSTSEAKESTDPTEAFDVGPWPTHIQIHVGAVLLAKLIDTAMVPSASSKTTSASSETILEPAFRHCIEWERGKQVGKMRAQDQLREKLMKAPLRASVGLTGHMPMLVEPKKWTGLGGTEGGPYYKYSPLLVRHKDEDDIQIMYTKAASEKGHLKKVYEGLDVLGKTAWKINNEVLQVMLEAWNSGEAVADLAPEDPQMTMPEEPDTNAEPEVRRAWRNEVRRVENEIGGLHSQRCFTNLQLEVAKAYKDKVFYYPHNIDFRGRAYPVPPFLNHMGADSARGLLIFSEGKKLGEEGLRWLKIHLSNLAGFDKASMDERVAYTESHMEDIRDSVENALGGKRWWLKAEDPWQCLGACFELKAAMDLEDPTEFVSRIPVAQDGSCNGLQHYAALGGDSFGAAQVNLEPSDRPADVYSGVAKLVKASIAKDAEEGDEMARVLLNKITRKVVKQTVMTNVYGVTFVGARAQVQKQLDAIMPDKSETEISNYVLASYIAKKIFKALATMFEGAHNIQYWLGECADRITRAITPEQIRGIIDRREGIVPAISRKYKDAAWKYWARKNEDKGEVRAVDFRTSVIWTTPLNLPVVQPYRAGKHEKIVTSLQCINFKEPRAYDPVNRRRQLQAFPPNFVHSLDATHMLLTALRCEEEGLSFAAVHDSFWTHARDVGTMSSILRDSFIKMHKDDVIGRLAEEFRVRYKGSLHLATVYARSPLGQRILELRREKGGRREWKGASLKTKTLQNELLEEWERQQLLASEDPEERVRGEGMKTPGALFAEAVEGEDFRVPREEVVATTSTSSTTAEDPEASLLEEIMASDVSEDHDHDGSDEAVEADDVEDDPNAIEGEEKGMNIMSKLAKRMNRKSAEPKVVVWAPLIFPKVPEKGDFDVESVRESTYFFA